ncbi:MAG: AraC family transcriptional regulator [Saprospiraceae bacterium]|nr:AraC family transcriptional regulator [Saprospiraceae bacterium]
MSIPIVQLNSASYFEDFDGVFDNRIFRSHLKDFEYEGKDTLLSVKVALNLPEFYYTPQRAYHIPAGHYCIINPKERLISELHFDQYADAISIFVSHDLLREVFAYWMGRHDGLRTGSLQDVPLPWFTERITPLHADPLGQFVTKLWSHPHQEIGDPDYFYVLAEHMFDSQRDRWQRVVRIPGRKLSTRLEALRRVELARDFIHGHLGQPFTLQKIASAAGMSVYHMSRQFKIVYGISPYQYALQIKMEHAARLLQSSGDAVTDIAGQVGFQDPVNFGKCFKARFGKPPGAMRKG